MSQKQRQNTPLMSYEDVPKTYDQLLAMHPLRPIHNDVELDHATTMIDILAGHDLNADQAEGAFPFSRSTGEKRRMPKLKRPGS